MKPDGWTLLLSDLEAAAKNANEVLLIRAVAEIHRRSRFQLRMNVLLMVAVALFSFAETVRWGVKLYGGDW